ncbi:hypothetical protein H6G81_21620 [Scytonema hofmannii FACHB-248]|uniref:DUF928 domain-containing protein n=1 Tax=Scytonema hofmannii FACHB-248 TaxID=1842502 RepID=A0ABR8GVF8_9CYAN|nr:MULTISPECIES: hypothetical protein [Nostocales]MBD2607055.1 hypothetical protein [Scytonema hofmannii FACHB-248]
MNKFLLPILVLSASLSTLPILPNQAQSAKKTATMQGFSWINISQALFSKKPPIRPRKGGSRLPTDDICMISPDAPSVRRIVWSDRPIFIWKGAVQKIAVRTRGSNEYLWSQNVAGAQNANYTGMALQPGQTYEWLVFIGEFPSKFVPFQVMDAQQSKRITSDLNNLIKAKKANSEAIALAKANYFIQNQLWSDALQQAYSVENPSRELAQILKDIPDKLCNQEQMVGSNSRSR